MWPDHGGSDHDDGGSDHDHPGTTTAATHDHDDHGGIDINDFSGTVVDLINNAPTVDDLLRARGHHHDVEHDHLAADLLDDLDACYDDDLGGTGNRDATATSCHGLSPDATEPPD